MFVVASLQAHMVWRLTEKNYDLRTPCSSEFSEPVGLVRIPNTCDPCRMLELAALIECTILCKRIAMYMDGCSHLARREGVGSPHHAIPLQPTAIAVCCVEWDPSTPSSCQGFLD
eukprot:scaffold932_cov328-Pavlova_lutheri.AAC.21